MNKDYPQELDELRRGEYQNYKVLSREQERKAAKAQARKDSLVNPRRK